MCICVFICHDHIDAWGSQMMTSDHMELQVVVNCLSWVLGTNFIPLEEDQMSLNAESSVQPPVSLFKIIHTQRMHIFTYMFTCMYAYVSVCMSFASMYVLPHCVLCTWRPTEDIRYPVTEVTNGCDCHVDSRN